jgi:hypothetical protein
LNRVTFNYQESLTRHLSSVVALGASSNTGTRNSFFDNLLVIGSNALRAAGSVVTETAAFAEAFSDVASRAFDDMHKYINEM